MRVDAEARVRPCGSCRAPRWLSFCERGLAEVVVWTNRQTRPAPTRRGLTPACPKGTCRACRFLRLRCDSLPHELRVLPGHTDETTLAREWKENPFVRVWRGLEPEGTAPCRVGGEEATLVV